MTSDQLPSAPDGQTPGRSSSQNTPWFRRRLVVLVPVVVLLVSAAIAWLEARRAPSIQWSQPAVLEFLVPGEARKVELTFRSDQRVDDVAVFVSPSLYGVLETSPTSFKRINGSQNTKLLLQLRAGTQSQVRFDGTIQLKASNSSATYAQPLPVTVVVHSQPVPPDPGDAGR